MQTVKRPYELLARWNQAGELQGVHVQFRYFTITDDGTVLGEFLGAAEPVEGPGATDFPLADLADRLQAVATTSG